MKNLIPGERIENFILLIRGQKVMLDRDLAELYGIKTSVLNQAVKRNIERFPEDFMFHLKRKEIQGISQNVISSSRYKNLKFSKSVSVFTEHGALMAANILKSKRAIEASIYVVRAFVRLRELLSTNKELAQKLTELERKLEGHDQAIHNIFEAIRQLLKHPESDKKKIGFHVREGSPPYLTLDP